MKKFIVVLVLFFGLAMVSTNSFAEEKALSDEGELSYVQTDGNTQVTSIAAKNLVKYRFDDKWLGSWKIGALRGETDHVRTAGSYYTDLKLDYQYTARLYFYSNAGWQRNSFAGIDKSYYGGFGAGYKLLDGPVNFLAGEVGVRYVADMYTNATTKDYPSGRAFAKYIYAFTDKNKFSQSLEYFNDFNDSQKYTVNSETAVISALSGMLSLKAAYAVNYVNAPVPATLQKKDTMTTMALVVNY